MQKMNKDRLIAAPAGRIISLPEAWLQRLRCESQACRNRIMKGTDMNIKSQQPDRIESYGIALGALIHAAWRALVWFFVPSDFDRHHLRGR